MNKKVEYKKRLLFYFSVAFIGWIFWKGLPGEEAIVATNELPQVTEISPVEESLFGTTAWAASWRRPEGPLRVGIQAGHWKYTEAPDELEGVRNNGGGTSTSGVPEWEVNLVIAEEIAEILRSQGIEADILPATIPQDYYADAFISIHADGSEHISKSGFKVAAPRFDLTGKARELARIIEEVYVHTTGIEKDLNITRSMTGYYAFSWRRYDHAIHPMTPAVIVETGFLSNPGDASILINQPEVPAQAIAAAVTRFLYSNKS